MSGITNWKIATLQQNPTSQRQQEPRACIHVTNKKQHKQQFLHDPIFKITSHSKHKHPPPPQLGHLPLVFCNAYTWFLSTENNRAYYSQRRA